MKERVVNKALNQSRGNDPSIEKFMRHYISIYSDITIFCIMINLGIKKQALCSLLQFKLKKEKTNK